MATPEGMIELSNDQSWTLLEENIAIGGGVGRVAVAIMNHPDIFPVNYAVDRTGSAPSVVFRTAEGTKLAASVLGTAVAFEIDGYDPIAGEAWSVVIKGSAQEVEGVHGVFDTDEMPVFTWHSGPKHRVVRISPEEITGRRFVVVNSD
jgi:nitroimidazol reductase NimA-like FMN-containing flavoprotein (pyridoxamine 5'-phosphate oxidase superfamily)